VDVVVHLADGLSSLQKPELAADAAQAERLLAASVRLTVAARTAKVPRLVYVSSIKAICDEDDTRVLTEMDEPRATSLYGRSKLRLEQSMAALLKGSDTRLTVVRNPAMYGAGKAGSVHRLLRLADTPFPLPLAGLPTSAPARRAQLRRRPGGDRSSRTDRAGRHLHIHDGPALSATEIVAALRAALGRPCRFISPSEPATAAATQAR
jgi:UDP-glucose 4-epimerase